MKNYFFIAAACLLMTACNQKEIDKSKADLLKSNHEKDSLLGIVTDRESTINNFISSFNDVERNLDSVAAKQHIISMNTDKQTELRKDQKARINSEILAINNLMDSNRKRINELSKKLKTSGFKNEQLEKTISFLNEQLSQKEVELGNLNEKHAALNLQVAELKTSVESLTGDNAKKSENITELTTSLHTAYYAIGKPKDLQASKIIDKKGGLLGIGKTPKLSSDLDNSKFIKIDYTKVGAIPINSGNVKVVTSHPTDSYTLEKDSNNKDVV